MTRCDTFGQGPIALVFPAWISPSPYPPLGIAGLAAVLEMNGFDVSLFDLSSPGCDVRVAREEIVALGPSIVGISCLTNGVDTALHLAHELKQRTSAKIVLGGPHATFFRRELAAHPEVDFVVAGEGEASLLQLARSREEDVASIPGLVFERAGRVHETSPAPLIDNIDVLPFPARHLLDLESYPLRTPWGEKMTTVMSSRGCPHACVYCYKGYLGRRFRGRSPANVVAELQHLMARHQYRCFYFNDDAFTVDCARVQSICDLIRDQHLNIAWQCSSRVDSVSPDLLQSMRASGCFKIHFGVESGDDQILQRIGKRIRRADVIQAVKAARSAGLVVRGYFMLGLPGDTAQTMRATIALAQDSLFDEVLFSLATPFPGSELWRKLPDDVQTKRDRFQYAFYHASADQMRISQNFTAESDDTILAFLQEAKTLESQKFELRRRAAGTAGSDLRPWKNDDTQND